MDYEFSAILWILSVLLGFACLLVARLRIAHLGPHTIDRRTFSTGSDQPDLPESQSHTN